MTHKNCSLCHTEIHQGYRIQNTPGKIWIFVCGKCCLTAKKKEFYRYGGTWKSKEKRL